MWIFDLLFVHTNLIGYHQRCHVPPIPASALELDTPWNCAYCLKGVKCPFLTESLDVLQNLLSEDEAHSHDEVDSVTTMESDDGGEEFNQHHPQHLSPPKPPSAPPPKKRVCKLCLHNAIQSVPFGPFQLSCGMAKVQWYPHEWLL